MKVNTIKPHPKWAGLAAGILVGIGSSALASPVTMDFTGGNYDNPWDEDGFRLQSVNPNNHNEMYGGVFNWHDGPANTAPNTWRWTDLTGDFLFDALSIDVLNNTQGLHFVASDSSFVNIPAGSVGTFSLGFHNISYFTMDVTYSGNDYPQTIDNVVLDHTQTPASSVPDGGSTIALLGLAMTAVAGARRKFGISKGQ